MRTCRIPGKHRLSIRRCVGLLLVVLPRVGYRWMSVTGAEMNMGWPRARCDCRSRKTPTTNVSFHTSLIMLPENKRRRSLVKTRMNTPFSIERNERKVAQLLECTVHPGEFDKHKCNLNDLYVRKANPRNTQRAQAVVGPSIA